MDVLIMMVTLAIIVVMTVLIMPSKPKIIQATTLCKCGSYKIGVGLACAYFGFGERDASTPDYIKDMLRKFNLFVAYSIAVAR